ncbi:MAG: hypothetical protein R3B93_19935 [Bacteroidia bacterium]
MIENLFTRGLGWLVLWTVVSFIISTNLYITGRKDQINQRGFWFPIVAIILFWHIIDVSNILDWYFD